MAYLQRSTGKGCRDVGKRRNRHRPRPPGGKKDETR